MSARSASARLRCQRLLEQQRPLRQLARQVVLAGADLARELVAPGGEHVGPGLDRELPAPDRVHREAARPAHATQVGIGAPHLGLAEFALAGPAGAHDGAQQVVAVAEDVGRDGHGVPDAALGRVAPGIDRGERVLDLDAGRRGLGGAGRRRARGAWRGAGRRGGHTLETIPSGARVNARPGVIHGLVTCAGVHVIGALASRR